MISQLVPMPWPRRRWWTGFALVFGLQVVLIFVLSDRRPFRQRPAVPAPKLLFADAAATELAELNDPTLFALPNPHGFSGLAWLKTPALEARQFDLTEPTNWLALSVNRLGLGSYRAPAPGAATVTGVTLPPPEVSPAGVAVTPLGPERSTCLFEGDLARRRLQTTLQLPAWAHSDLLTNTIVELVVDAQGRAFAIPSLLTSSGHKEADDYALRLARSMRFEPVRGNWQLRADQPPELSWGKLIFEWSTVPLTATNAPPAVQP